MQTDIQTFKHWTAASKPNSWLLGLATSQPDKPLPTGASQIFLGDPQSHRRSFGLGLHCGSGVQGIFHPSGLPGVEEAACLGQSNHCDFAPTPVDWPRGSIPSGFWCSKMFKDIEDWRTQTKNQQGADNVDRLPGTRIRLPGHFSIFFPSKCSDSRGFSPGVHSRSWIGSPKMSMV